MEIIPIAVRVDDNLDEHAILPNYIILVFDERRDVNEFFIGNPNPGARKIRDRRFEYSWNEPGSVDTVRIIVDGEVYQGNPTIWKNRSQLMKEWNSMQPDSRHFTNPNRVTNSLLTFHF